MPGNCSFLRSFACRKASRSFGFCHARDPSDRRLPIINPAFVLSARHREQSVQLKTPKRNYEHSPKIAICDLKRKGQFLTRGSERLTRHGRLFRFLCADARDSGVHLLQIGADRDLRTASNKWKHDRLMRESPLFSPHIFHSLFIENPFFYCDAKRWNALLRDGIAPLCRVKY